MYYIIRDGYSVINEKDNIAFYDIKTKRMINVFNIKGSTEYSVAELLNNPINTDLLDEVWSRYWKLITGNNSIMQFFVQVDEFAYLDEKKNTIASMNLLTLIEMHMKWKSGHFLQLLSMLFGIQRSFMLGKLTLKNASRN